MQPGVLVVVLASSASMGVEVAGSTSGLFEAMEKRVAKKSIDWFESRMCSVVRYGSMRCAETSCVELTPSYTPKFNWLT
jgi:hypothetical protein